MKTRKTTRILSAFLATVMVFLMLPISVVYVSAADYNVPTTEHKLLSTYDAIWGGDITEGTGVKASVNHIFVSDKMEELLQTSSNYTSKHAQIGEMHQGKDMSSFSRSLGVSISRDVGASIGVEKIFKLGASQKFNVTADVSYSEAVETYFYEYVVTVEKAYFSFDESSLAKVKNYSNGYLTENFINALTGVDGTTPEAFFKKYGTHIITGYTAGGKAGVYSSSIKTDSSSQLELSTLYGSGAEGSGTYEGITLGVNGALEIKAKLEAQNTSQEFKSQSQEYAYGGDRTVAFSNNQFQFTSWGDSVTADNGHVIADDKLRFVPIWELLPDVGYADRLLDLMDYYLTQSEAGDQSFYEKYGLDLFEQDWSHDWLGFDNCTIITNEADLNRIRENLNGVYVLANDIVLSEYANWEPIGTKENPFTGRLYGNNNTISGLNISLGNIDSETTGDTLVGLFGCNNGLITDVKLEGAISASAINKENVYVGSIVAYNNGIVNNCFGNVEYNTVILKAVEDFNFATKQEITENTTYNIRDDSLGLHLVGQSGTTYSNVNIIVEESDRTDPVYIVLENVNIVGKGGDKTEDIKIDSIENATIYNPTSRPIYLISQGTSNTIQGASLHRVAVGFISVLDGSPAVYTPKSDLHILGDADLNVLGGDAVGTDGSASCGIYCNILTVNSKSNVLIAGGGESYLHFSRYSEKAISSENEDNLKLIQDTVVVFVGNKRYGLYELGKLNWDDAKNQTFNDGEYLVSITSEEEQNLINTMLDYAHLGEYHIGAYRVPDNVNTWAWVTGESFEYINWASGEPNDVNEDCADIYREDKKWNDYAKSHESGYISECDDASSFINNERKNILAGTVVAYNTVKGKEKNSNSEKWNENPLKVTAVTKTQYYSSAKNFYSLFDSSTITVTCDGVNAIATYSGSFGTPGISAITVTYGEYERLVPIYIIKTVPTSMEIVNADAIRTDYELWDLFELPTALKVTYNDGSEKEIQTSNSDVKHTEPDMTKLGEQEIVITYFDVETKYTITVDRKTVNGTVKIVGTPEVNSTLTVQVTSIDPEEATANISYEWFMNGVLQSTGNSLPVKESMAGQNIILKVSLFGNYQGSFEDTITIRKKDQSAPTTPPQVTAKTNTSVTLETVAGMEYTYCVGNVIVPEANSVWQNDGVFENLLPNTTYSFFSRMKESQVANASAASAATVVTTLKTTLTGSLTIQGGTKSGETLSANLSGVLANAEVSYQWYRNGVAISSATEASYTLTDADKGTDIYLIIRGVNTYTGELQSNTVSIDSGVISPDAPQLVVPDKMSTPGGTVRIPITLANNPGVWAMAFEINIDENVFEFVSADTTTSIFDQFGACGYDAATKSYKFNGYHSDLFQDITEDGTVVTLTLKVKENVTIGQYVLAVKQMQDQIVNVEEENVTFISVDGMIDICEYVLGDVNGDGKVTNADVLRIFRYIYNATSYPMDTEAAADVNGDGKITNADVLRIFRYIYNAELYPLA